MRKKIIIIAIIVLLLVLIYVARFLYLKKDSGQPITAKDAISSFSENQLDVSFKKLDSYILNPKLHKDAAIEAIKYLNDSNDEKRFAAIYLLTLTGTPDDKEQLATALSDKKIEYQIIAAGTLIGWGDFNAIPILINSLSSDALLPYSAPPQPVSSLALQALPYYTEANITKPTDNTQEAKIKYQDEWKKWWETNKNNLSWDNNSKKFISK